MNPFVKVYSPFYQKWKKFLDYRWPTTQIALNLFEQAKGQVIVETGCIRQAEDSGAGYSTYIYGEYLKARGSGHLWSIDNTQLHLDIARGLTHQFNDVITYVHGDSVEELRRFGRGIDFLYLDSFDYPIVDVVKQYEGEYQEVAHKMVYEIGDAAVLEAHPELRPPQEHCLAELDAALPYLQDKAVVLLDDNGFPGGGKPPLAKERLIELGWTCLLDDGQSVWIRR